MTSIFRDFLSSGGVEFESVNLEVYVTGSFRLQLNINDWDIYNWLITEEWPYLPCLFNPSFVVLMKFYPSTCNVITKIVIFKLRFIVLVILLLFLHIGTQDEINGNMVQTITNFNMIDFDFQASKLQSVTNRTA